MDGFDAVLMLYAPDDELIEGNDDHEGIWHARIQEEVESTGEYRVVVASYAPGDTGSTYRASPRTPVVPEVLPDPGREPR